MNSAVSQSSPGVGVGKAWLISLWLAQFILAALFGMAGVMKTTMAPAMLASSGMAWAADVPLLLVRFIGLVELAGTVGVILPALTRILPVLTPLAAAGFATIQVLAIGFHATRGETAETLPINIVLLALSLFVVWGRFRKAPIQPR